MQERTLSRGAPEYPPLLTEVPDAPHTLHLLGTLPDPTSYRYLAVVGSRTYTAYGKHVCESLIRGLAGYPVCIVSGLALGIDGIAHTAALEAHLPTVAVPGSGLSPTVLYPAVHRSLARRILEEGGALISEFPNDWKPRPESFPQRNRVMAGMSHAVLVIEATERSGTLITARLAMEYNRDVFAVPGPIEHATSRGPHHLLKNGAALIAESADILAALGIAEEKQPVESRALTEDEAWVIGALTRRPHTRDELLRLSPHAPSATNALLAALELKGLIEERLGAIYLH